MHQNTWRKLKVNLNWLWTIDYGFFWLYFSVSCSTWCSKSTKSMKPNEASVSDWLRFFLSFAKNYYFKRKLSFFINTLLRKHFSNSGVTSLTLLYIMMVKSISSSGKSIFWSGILLKTNFFTISALIPSFSVYVVYSN